MGPDEQLSSMCYLVATPIGTDGARSEPIKFENLKPIALEEDQDLDLTKKNKLIFNTAWSGEFNVKFRYKKISKKTFKKWCMSKGISRNDADILCGILGIYNGGVSYQNVYHRSIFALTFHTVLTNILNEGVKNSWMKK